MAPVQLFVYQDDCIFQPYELFLDIETTCRAEMKPVAWRFVLFPDQFVRDCKLAAGRGGMCMATSVWLVYLSSPSP